MLRVDNIQQDTNEDIPSKPRSSNVDKNRFVIAFKDEFDKNFPNDFDAWTVNKQYTWINQNIEKFAPNLPQSLQNLIPGTFCPLNDDDRPPEELPEWMNMKKYREGQKFVQAHYTAITFATIMGLTYVYSVMEIIQPLILGEHTHTPYLGFQKYSSIIKRVTNWFYGDPWIKGTQAYKDMFVTRRMHLALKKKEHQMDHEQIEAACTFANPWCPDHELLLQDFATACPFEKFGVHPYNIVKNSSHRPKSTNNAVFAGVQSLFIVLPLLHPKNAGIHGATDEDLEAFCHLWRCYGYFLGIEDEYNICRGSLDEIKQRVRNLYEYLIIPSFREFTPQGEHIMRCLIMCLNYFPVIYLPHKTATLLAMDALNLNMPYLYKSLNYTEWITYKIYKFLLYSLKIPFVRVLMNQILLKIFNKASNYDAEKLKKIHENSKQLVPDFSLNINY